MKRTARKYQPASRTENTLVMIGGIVVWGMILAPLAWWLGGLLR
jgi:hypothetical protein